MRYCCGQGRPEKCNIVCATADKEQERTEWRKWRENIELRKKVLRRTCFLDRGFGRMDVQTVGRASMPFDLSAICEFM